MSDRPMLHLGMHALSPEMAIGGLRNRDHGHVVADGPTEEILDVQPR